MLVLCHWRNKCSIVDNFPVRRIQEMRYHPTAREMIEL